MKIRSFVLALIALIVLSLAGSVFAQDPGSGVTVVIAPSGEETLDPHTVLTQEPTTLTMLSTSVVNMRMEPTKTAPVIGTVPANVQINAQLFMQSGEATNQWDLVRAWRTDNGNYVGFGWVSHALFTSTTLKIDASVKPINVAACARKDEGVVLNQRAKVGVHYVFDSLTSGCNEIFEGRYVVTPHHYVVTLRSGDQSSNMLLYGLYVFREGTIREYPVGWNMQDFTTKKPPIAAELVNAKRHNMQANKYDFPITAISTDGTALTFAPGKLVDGVVLPNNCDFTEPQLDVVTALVLTGEKFQYDASIGAEGCRSIAWGQMTEKAAETTVMIWTGAQDNIQFNDVITAYTLPKGYTDDQIRTFFASQKLAGTLIYTGDATTILGKTGS